MSRLIIGAPRPHCVSNMTASKLDLRVITHELKEGPADAVNLQD
jgi:hypothetical protein